MRAPAAGGSWRSPRPCSTATRCCRSGDRRVDRRRQPRRPRLRRPPEGAWRLTSRTGKRAAGEDGRQTGPALQPGDFKRAFTRFRGDQITDNAAALTYYSLLSLFPALLFGTALLGVFGQQALITNAADYLKNAGAPQDTVDAVTGALRSAQQQRGTAVVALIIGLATSLNGASGAFGAVGRALNKIFRVEEGRGFVTHKLHDLLWTLIVMV